MSSLALFSDLPTPPAPSIRRAHWRPTPLEGATLRDTYRLLEPLGRGGMSIVYRALHLRLGHQVAVKLMAPVLAGDLTALARFRREAELLVELRHPNIVRVLDYDMTPDGEPYIVMDLIEGESLADLIDRSGTVPLQHAVRITTQIGAALSHAHARGVLHRDLKPTNVMLDSEKATLLDFGIAKHTTRQALTQAGMVGTPEYMAPEQAELAAQIDERADQYALALCTFEMLSGAHPFWHREVSQVVALVRAQNRPRLTEIAPHVPAEVAAVVERGMHKDRAARHRSVRDFTAALRRAAHAAEHADDATLLDRLGGPSALLRRSIGCLPHETDLTPLDAYVLSRLEAEMTLEDLIDATALAQRDALRAVSRLVHRGLIVSCGLGLRGLGDRLPGGRL